MKRRTNKRRFVNIILHILAFLFCTVPPMAATLAYFPLWKDGDTARLISGGALLLLLISALPIYRFIKAHIESFAVWGVWLVFFILFFLLERIAHEVTVISFSGFVGNLVGAILFKLSSGGLVNEKV